MSPLRASSFVAASLVAVAALVILASGCTKVAPPAPPTTVDVVVAQPIVKRIVEWDEYTGRLEPIEFVEIRARVGGFLKKIDFVEGQIVNKGDLLCVIDPRPYESAKRRADAALHEARARLVQTESDLGRAVAAQKEIESQVKLEEQRYDRAKQLVGRNTITQEEFDIRESTLSQARAQLESAAAGVATAKAAIEVATAAVETAEAELHTANINLGYTQVKAPISGRVSRREVTEGNLISGGTADSTLLTTIVSLDPIHVTFDADEAAFLKYQRMTEAGTRASSRYAKNPVFLALADEAPAFPHKGHMDFVDNRLDPNTGTMRGRAILRNSDFVLTPGLFARIRIPGSGAYDAVLISDGSIQSDQSDKFVFVVEADGTIRRQPVAIGGSIHGLRIVQTGLKGDEEIIIRGTQRVRPGLKAKTTNEKLALQGDEDLPNEYEPVPESEWISRDANYLPHQPSSPVKRPVRTVRAATIRTALSRPE